MKKQAGMVVVALASIVWLMADLSSAEPGLQLAVFKADVPPR